MLRATGKWVSWATRRNIQRIANSGDVRTDGRAAAKAWRGERLRQRVEAARAKAQRPSSSSWTGDLIKSGALGHTWPLIDAIDDDVEQIMSSRSPETAAYAAPWFADEPAQQEKPQRGSSPHCGYPGKSRNWYSNLSGVLTVEHPVPKMDSVRLPNSDLLRTVSQGRACTGASSTKLRRPLQLRIRAWGLSFWKQIAQPCCGGRSCSSPFSIARRSSRIDSRDRAALMLDADCSGSSNSRRSSRIFSRACRFFKRT